MKSCKMIIHMETRKQNWGSHLCLLGSEDEDEEGEQTTSASVDCIRRARKEAVEIEMEMEGFDEGLKEDCSHSDASVSGHVEFMNISSNGTHDSILDSSVTTH